MADNKDTAISGIKSYVAGAGGHYSGWYVGIASDPRTRLFNDHAVREKGDCWIYRLCTSSQVARDVEDYFIQLGMQGGPGGGDDSSKYVYAYKIAPHTVE